MKSTVRLTLLSFVIFIFSCSKSDNNSGSGTHNCSFSTPILNAPNNGTVKYETKLTGTGQVTQIVLKTLNGDSTIHNPGLPFQVTLPVNGGTALGISAVGTTTGGTISIEFSFVPAGGGSEAKDENDCGN